MVDFSGELGARARERLMTEDVEAYLAKYRADIEAIGMTPESLSATYSVLLRAVPTKLRGM